MENTNINDAAIKRSNIPNNWSYCFNSNCKRCNECIHFRSSVALDSSRTQGNAIFPQPCGQTVRAITSNQCAWCAWHQDLSNCLKT